MYGCDKFCTYCRPYTRGKGTLQAHEDILKKKIEEVKADGYQEITLLGQKCQRLWQGIWALMMALASFLGRKVGQDWYPSHPFHNVPSLGFYGEDAGKSLLSMTILLPYIHLPLQSGNNDILKLINRRYTVEEVHGEIYHKLKELMPNCAFSTGTSLSASNETDEQFEDTLRMVDYFQFDKCLYLHFLLTRRTPAGEDGRTMFPMETRRNGYAF